LAGANPEGSVLLLSGFFSFACIESNTPLQATGHDLASF
jgi:hypothetical protein